MIAARPAGSTLSTPSIGWPPDWGYSSAAAMASAGKSGVMVRLRHVSAMPNRP